MSVSKKRSRRKRCVWCVPEKEWRAEYVRRQNEFSSSLQASLRKRVGAGAGACMSAGMYASDTEECAHSQVFALQGEKLFAGPAPIHIIYMRHI